MKVISFRLKLSGQEVVIKNQNQLNDLLEEYNKKLKSTRSAVAFLKVKNDIDKITAAQLRLNAAAASANRKTREDVAITSKSYRGLQIQLSRLTNQYKQLGEAQRNSTKGAGILNNIKSVRGEISKIDTSLGKGGGGLGGLVSGFGSLGAIAAGGAVAGLFNEARKAVVTFADFDAQLRIVQSVAGATNVEFLKLKENAEGLGASTQFTAIQVAKLQTVLAKIGFTASEVLQSTDAIVNLSIGIGENLADTGQFVAESIRAYGLAAEDAGLVTDTFAFAINKSALNLNNLREASKQIAPVARNLGVPFQEAIATIAALSNNSLTGTQATTTLSSALLRLSQDSKVTSRATKELKVEIFDQFDKFVGLDQVVQNLTEATGDLTDKQALSTVARITGIEASRTFLSLIEQEKKQRELEAEGYDNIVLSIGAYNEALQDSEGFAAGLAEVIENTLDQDLKKLNSAFVQLGITITSKFNSSLRGATQDFTSFLTVINEFLANSLSEELESESARLDILTTSLKSNIDNNVVRLSLIKDIKREFPEFAKTLILERANVREINKALEIYNSNQSKRIEQQKIQETFDAALKERNKLVQSETTFSRLLTIQEKEGNKVRADNARSEIANFKRQRQNITLEIAKIIKSAEGIGKDFSVKLRNEFLGIGNEVGENVADETAKSLDEKLTTNLQELLGKQKKLRTAIEDALAGGTSTGRLDGVDVPVNNLNKEFVSVGIRINKVKESINDLTEATKLLGRTGSIRRLNEEISLLQKRITESNDPVAIEGYVERTKELTQELEAAKFAIEDLKKEGALTIEATVTSRRTDIEDDSRFREQGILEAAELELRSTGVTEEERLKIIERANEEIKIVRRETAIAIAELEREFTGEGTDERVAADLKVNELRIAQAKEASEEVLKDNKEVIDELAEFAQRRLFEVNQGLFEQEDRGVITSEQRDISSDIAGLEIQIKSKENALELNKVSEENVASEEEKLELLRRQLETKQRQLNASQIEQANENKLFNDKKDIFDLEETGLIGRQRRNELISNLEKQNEIDILNDKIANNAFTENEKEAAIRRLYFLEKGLEDDLTSQRLKRIQDQFDAAAKIFTAISGFRKDEITRQEEEDKESAEERRDTEIEAVNERYEAEIEAAKGNAEAKKQLEKQRDEEIKELERQKAEEIKGIELVAAKRRKDIALQEAIIAAALATIKAAPNPFAIAATAALGLVQIGIISSTPVETFQRGGTVEGSESTSHANGGVKYRVKSTGKIAELEGREGILSKRTMKSTKIHRLQGTPSEIASKLNTSYGGNAMRIVRGNHFRDGGLIGNENIPAPAVIARSSSEVTYAIIKESQMKEFAEMVEGAVARGTEPIQLVPQAVGAASESGYIAAANELIKQEKLNRTI